VVDAVEQIWLRHLDYDLLALESPVYRGRLRKVAFAIAIPLPSGDRVAWLTGPFAEAWLRVRGNTKKAKREARARFLEPLMRHLDEAGLNHISEIADGDAPILRADVPSSVVC